MKGARACSIGAASATLLLTLTAHAETTSLVLSVTGCEAAAVPADRLFDLARTELLPRRLIAAEPVPPMQAAHLFVRLCQGSANQVTIELRTYSGQSSRQLDLSDVVGDLRVRTLAVALAELVAASSTPAGAPTELARDATLPSNPANAPAVPPPPNAAPPPANAVPPPPNQAQPNPLRAVMPAPAVTAAPTTPQTRSDTTAAATSWRKRRYSLAANFALREFLAPRTTLIGPWLVVGFRRVSADAQWLMTSHETSIGQVRLYNANLGAGYQLISIGGAIATMTNVRAELGLTRAVGVSTPPNTADTATRLHGGLGLDWCFAATLPNQFGIELHLLGGVNAHSVTASAAHQDVASTQGVFVGLGMGLHYAGVE